jgi:Ca2+-binding EF-hand superfamily protein
MSISAISGASSANALQQLLSLLQSQAQSGAAEAGQNQPDQANGAERDPPRGPPPGPPPSGGSSGSQFNGVTLAQLLSSQSTTDGSTSTTSATSLSATPNAQQFASQLISQLGGSGGEVSLSQIESSLGLSSSHSSDASTISSLTNAFKQLDTNGDGELSTSELASALPSGPPQGPPPFVGGAASSSSDISSIANTLSSDLISALGGSNGQVTLAEWTSALSGSGQTDATSTASGSNTSNQKTDAAAQLFNGLDTNGDGSLSTSEITSALQAFLSGQATGQSDAAQGQNSGSLLA